MVSDFSQSFSYQISYSQVIYKQQSKMDGKNEEEVGKKSEKEKWTPANSSIDRWFFLYVKILNGFMYVVFSIMA